MEPQRDTSKGVPFIGYELWRLRLILDVLAKIY